MALSWNEIKDRALKFSNEWADETKERAEKDSFWNDFFNVFGISRRRVATFEEPIKKLNNKQGFIDLFWKGTLLVEHKSKGKNLDAAFEQATDYFYGIEEHELPKYVLVSDFEKFRLYDLDEKTETEFLIRDFYKHVKLFGFIAGYQKRTFKEEDPVNMKAAELMGKLHDQLKETGYEGHPLEIYLVRLLFVLFADDTSIFEKDIFKEYIDQKTKTDGSDLGALLAQFFQVLNTPKEKRLKNLDEHLIQFPYVNGKLFEEQLPIAAFNTKMRSILLEAGRLDWGKISPAIFGSMFQSVMNPVQRRNLGAHYTSEKNILKLIKPLFLDDLYAEFNKIKHSKNKLKEFHQKLGKLKFLDPACGCGNFLIITYRELRLLELEVLKQMYGTQQVIGIDHILNVDVDQFYGIEYDEFPVRIAEVALWLTDHQMNLRVSEAFGLYYVRLPLRKSAKIIHGNALRIDWDFLVKGEKLSVTSDQTNIIEVSEPLVHYDTINVYTKKVIVTSGEIPDDENVWKSDGAGKVDYILGNPPFVGTTFQTKQQKADMKLVFAELKNTGGLDYVSAWYLKAARYMQNSETKAAFVSTNSLSQGEQVGILWNELYKLGMKIHFAHRTFRWNNEAKGNAAVHVVIIGFGKQDIAQKKIYYYDDLNAEPHEETVKNINPYLLEGADYFISRRSKPLCNVPPMTWGNKPVDGGNLILTEAELEELKEKEPQALQFVKKFMGGQELIQDKKRWCLWLVDTSPNELRKMPLVLERIKKVREMRLASVDLGARKLASVPSQFRDTFNPASFIAVPEVSSERRKYIPIAFFDNSTIASNTVQIVANAGLFHFGVLNSIMHMEWMRYVAGRLESRYRYSNSIVYNNFPWPKEISEKSKKLVEEKAQKVLNVRAEFQDAAVSSSPLTGGGGREWASLADLYDPLTMPPKLVKAHNELDKAVDLCYRPQPFTTENARIEFLFALYKHYTVSLKN